MYFNKGSTGGCANFMTGLSRMVSLLCRAGVSIFDIKDQLDSTGVCPSYATRRAVKHDTSDGSCCPMAIGNALVDMWEEVNNEGAYTGDVNKTLQEIQNTSVCPECGAEV